MIFDLWDTLVEWPSAEGVKLIRRLAGLAGLSADELEQRVRVHHRTLQTGPLSVAHRTIGIPDAQLAAAAAAHHDLCRRALRLRDGGAEALALLRSRGLRLGLITVCSEDVPLRWPETDMAGLFDVETFSSQCGLMKPEPEIYLRTSRALGVPPHECLFVGDGANDELAGAERVGMRSVLYLPHGETPRWPELREWTGLRVSTLEEVSLLC